MAEREGEREIGRWAVFNKCRRAGCHGLEIVSSDRASRERSRSSVIFKNKIPYKSPLSLSLFYKCVHVNPRKCPSE